MVPQNISLKDHYKGDTFKGFTFRVSKNGVAIDVTNAIIKCQFIKNQGPVQQLITLADYIEIIDGPDGKVRINPFVIDWPGAIYFFDIEFDISGLIQTYVKGSLVVQADITPTS